MAAGYRWTPHALLTRHFLKQFLENDLISPEADRSQFLAVATATIVCLTLFVSTMMSFTYVVGALMTPGLAAVLSLEDKYFYLAFGMIVTALVAASQWDALAIDARDAAILEPLPVSAATIRRAKLSAVTLLGGAASIAVNVLPSLVFPLLLMYPFRQASFASLLGLIATHAVITVAAALFGYLTIVTLRETMMAVLGVRWFTRVSPWVQGALIVVLGGSLLLLPAAMDRIAQQGFDGWRAASPPMWFLGAYEMTVGRTLVDLPRTAMRPRQAENDRLATTLYREREDRFPALARRAGVATSVTLLIGATAYAWNARRRQSVAALPPSARRRAWPWFRALVNALVLRRSAARAGFYFAVAAMWRSNTHRLTLACAAAVGFAMAVVALSKSTLSSGNPSPRLLAVQPLVYGALLVGFRHAVRLPAELRANWAFQLAWRDQTRAFVAGVKAAAALGLVLPAVVVVLPIDLPALGLRGALEHVGLGLAGGLVFIELLMLTYEKVPFTCSYLPSENMKALAPLYAMAFVAGASLFAQMQHDALAGSGGLRALVIIGVAFVLLRVVSARRAPAGPIQFDEAPSTFQRLGLDQ